MKQIYKKENRILLSMITGMIVISLLCGIQWRGSQKNVLAWWGSIYPEFCFTELDRYVRKSSFYFFEHIKQNWRITYEDR